MKTTLIEGIAEIKKIGNSCVGSMAWESPYIIFEVDGVKYNWHSDNIFEIAKKLDNLTDSHLQHGRFFDIKMRVRHTQVWRMLKLEYR